MVSVPASSFRIGPLTLFPIRTESHNVIPTITITIIGSTPDISRLISSITLLFADSSRTASSEISREYPRSISASRSLYSGETEHPVAYVSTKLSKSVLKLLRFCLILVIKTSCPRLLKDVLSRDFTRELYFRSHCSLGRSDGYL